MRFVRANLLQKYSSRISLVQTRMEKIIRGGWVPKIIGHYIPEALNNDSLLSSN